MVEWSRQSPSAGLFARGSTPLLRSNETAAVAGTTLASPSYAIIDDMASSDPSTWVLNTVAASGGKQLTDAINSIPDKTLFFLPEFLGGETGFPTAGSVSSAYNSQVTGSPYVGELGEAATYRIMQGFTKLVGLLRTLTGNSALVLGVDVVNVSNDLARIAQLLWVANNPTLGYIASGNPFHTKVPDTSVVANTDHYSVASNFANIVICGRTRAWWRDQNSRMPTGYLTRPAYGQFPSIASVSAVAGNAFIDVTFNLPNGGGLVLGATPTRGWEARTGTTSTAIGAGGATYETGGSSLTITGVTLKPGSTNTVRLALSASLSAGKLAVFYGRNGSPGTASGAGFGDMLADDASTSAAAEPYLESRFRVNMPALICPQGATVTVA